MVAGAAFYHLRLGRKVRCQRWTEGCWVSAHYDPDIAIYVFVGYGTPTFRSDVAEDPAFILRDLMGPHNWEIEDVAQS